MICVLSWFSLKPETLRSSADPVQLQHKTHKDVVNNTIEDHQNREHQKRTWPSNCLLLIVDSAMYVLLCSGSLTCNVQLVFFLSRSSCMVAWLDKEPVLWHDAEPSPVCPHLSWDVFCTFPRQGPLTFPWISFYIRWLKWVAIILLIYITNSMDLIL